MSSTASSPARTAGPSDLAGRTIDLAVRDGISLRNAALVTGIREVALALEARGIYP